MEVKIISKSLSKIITVLILSVDSAPVSSAILEYNWVGVFTVLDPNGGIFN